MLQHSSLSHLGLSTARLKLRLLIRFSLKQMTTGLCQLKTLSVQHPNVNQRDMFNKKVQAILLDVLPTARCVPGPRHETTKYVFFLDPPNGTVKTIITVAIQGSLMCRGKHLFLENDSLVVAAPQLDDRPTAHSAL